MEIVILCGGKGSRLREETEYRPKPMLPIGSQPILWHIMKTYAHYGHTKFTLCLGYKGQIIKDFFLNYRFIANDVTVELGQKGKVSFHNPCGEEDWTVSLIDTGEETMTGCRVKRIEKFIQGDTFMLTYGDGVGNIDIDALLKFHKSHGKIGTLTGVRPPGRFGELSTVDGRICEFNEKPQVGAGLINGGYFVFSRRFFEFLSNDPNMVLEQEPLRSLAAQGELMCYSHGGFWQPMDTYREYEMLNQLWKNNQAPWKIW